MDVRRSAPLEAITPPLRRMAHRIVRGNGWYSAEDALQVGLIDAWQSDRDEKLTLIHAQSAMRDDVRQKLHTRAETREVAVAELPETSAPTPLTDDLLDVAEAAKNLTPREKYVVSAIAYRGLTLKEVAAEMGVTDTRVCQIRKKAVAKLVMG